MNIIYIDDDATNRAVLRDMLKLKGIAMVEAPDARSGLKLISEGSFDLIFMDLRMPDMNGLTAIRQIRAAGNQGNQGHRIPIVAVTAELSEGIKELGRTAGADAFLEKPIMLESLFDTIASLRKKPARP
ncbi:MAG TPA: response regulator [Sphingomonas sp.]|nr:response regulator [Sphingomonas sp.]